MFRLKELRESRGISQVRLAIELDLNQNSISRYESGAREADYKTLLAIADYFDVSMDYIFARCEEPQGKLYQAKPPVENNPELAKFVEMCFDPESPMHDRLKATLIEMVMGKVDG